VISPHEKDANIKRLWEEKYGFALLFRHIWLKNGLTFIGHNCFLDLMYVYNSLIDTLPDNYFDYKEVLRLSGHSFYDTKFMALHYPELSEEGTRLEDIVRYLLKTAKKNT
jgi:hypothetical protein